MPTTRSTQPSPSGALVFDLRSLSRQAGSSRTEKRIVPAPADLRLELAAVPEGSDVELNLKFEAVTEGVLVSGSATALVAGDCARCLGPVSSTVTVSFLELYRYQDDRSRAARRERARERERDLERDREQEPGNEEEERFLVGDLLDLEPAFRDAVVLALPMSPLCRQDCQGLCIECGIPLAEAGSGHKHDDLPDPRWAGLTKLQPKEG